MQTIPKYLLWSQGFQKGIICGVTMSIKPNQHGGTLSAHCATLIVYGIMHSYMLVTIQSAHSIQNRVLLQNTPKITLCSQIFH